MISLNRENGAEQVCLKYAKIVKDRFANPVYVEFGNPYGGTVEELGKLCKADKGTVYGFDTYEGHPKELSYSQKSHEAYCMDPQYEIYGKQGLLYEYQRGELDKQGLMNVILKKGLINDNSLDGINEVHYCMIDLDMINPMALAITIVEPVLVKGSFLMLHDAVPRGHIFGLWGLYQELLASKKYRLVEEVINSYLVVLEKL